MECLFCPALKRELLKDLGMLVVSSRYPGSRCSHKGSAATGHVAAELFQGFLF